MVVRAVPVYKKTVITYHRRAQGVQTKIGRDVSECFEDGKVVEQLIVNEKLKKWLRHLLSSKFRW